jgi:hypothetical protein
MHGDVMTALWYCLRGLSAGAGLLLLYAAFFLYEEEQQRVQSAIEVRVIDRIFGPSSLSLQSFAVSTNLIFISYTLV